MKWSLCRTGLPVRPSVTSSVICLWLAMGGLVTPALAESPKQAEAIPEAMKPAAPTPPALRLSLNEALALFLRQNLDLIIGGLGVDFARAEQITARLLPNPVLTVGTLTSFTQGNTLSKSGQVLTSLDQLFEMAGKRGFRIERAVFGAGAAEANFEDALRQLTFTVKDAYFRMQLAQRRLALAEENRDRFSRILEINTIRFKKGYIAEVDLIRIRLQVVDFQAQVIQETQEVNAARNDLRVLLGVTPATDLLLTTELDYRRVDPDIETLRLVALDARPDIRLKRLAQSQRQAELKLAKALRYPDITLGASYAPQGPLGPDLSQMWGMHAGLPLPLFNRNQGGIAQAEVSIQAAAVDLRKTLLQVESDVDVAYRNLLQSRQLTEAYRAGVLEDARLTLIIVEKAYERGGATLLDLLDAARTSRTIQMNYIEALFNYQHNVFLLESSVGREISA